MAYRQHLRDVFRAHLGSNAVLITTDGAGLNFLKCGAVDGVYATVDFGPGVLQFYEFYFSDPIQFCIAYGICAEQFIYTRVQGTNKCSSKIRNNLTGNASAGFSPMRKWNPKGPLVNSEFYTGWLDHWGSAHAHTDAQTIAKTLDEILRMNASVNFYMFIGGTNFGYMNGMM